MSTFDDFELVPPDGKGIGNLDSNDFINALARATLVDQHEELERQILSGAKSGRVGVIAWERPAWWRHPIRRLKLEVGVIGERRRRVRKSA